MVLWHMNTNLSLNGKLSYSTAFKLSLNPSSPPEAGRCASAPAPPVDRVGGGILAAGCTSAWSTGPLYILLSAHFRAGGETWFKRKKTTNVNYYMIWWTVERGILFSSEFSLPFSLCMSPFYLFIQWSESCNSDSVLFFRQKEGPSVRTSW